MKINKEPLSAFTIYSEKLKQKKKSKHGATNGVNKLKTKSNVVSDLKMAQMKEIGNILKKLAEKSNNTSDIHHQVKVADSRRKLKRTNKNLAQKLVSDKKINKKEKIPTKQISSKGNNANHAKKRNLEKISSNINVGGSKNTPNIDSADQDTCFTNHVSLVKNIHSKIESDIEKNNSDVITNKQTKFGKTKYKADLKKKRLEKIEKKRANKGNSILAANDLFEWVIQPILQQDFMRLYWEKQPLLIKRENNRDYYSNLLSTPAIDVMLRENNVHFTKHLDVTSYADGERATHNLSGRAQANVVWDFYSNGCSIRLLNPQAFIPKIHALNATLQEYFGCFIGANVYLTPPNSQGFAPHYDDIEAFVLQVEGKKHWKVYPPRNGSETLPRFSSPNFSQEEIGEPFLDVTLESGDMLYFPRGFIHQASTVEGEHSLHITLSAYQKTAWVDLFEKTLPLALKRAAAEDVEFRRGLPRDYLGIEFHGSDADKVSFTETAQKLMTKLGHYLSLTLGAGVDQMGAQFMHDALPPVFTPDEKQHSELGAGLKMKENGKLVDRVEFQLNTRVKLIRANICRLVEEEDEVRLYHCLDNPLEYHAEEPQFLVLPQEGIDVIMFLSHKYPAYVEVKTIPHEDDEALLALVSDLWDAGLLVTRGLLTTSTDVE